MFPRTVEIAWREFQRTRDPRALAIVFDRTAPELQALGRHLASPGTDADDLVQATFVTAIEDAASFRAGERLVPWLVGILVNHARAARRRSRRSLDATRLPQPIADATADVVANEVTAELRAAIDKLPEVYRPVLRLVCEHGLAANEIARTLERPAGTVRAQVTRGLELLRRTLPASLAGGVAVTVAAGRGLAAVRSEVLARCGGTATGFVSAVTLGGLFVLQHKLVAALAAVVLLVVGAFWFDHEPAVAADPVASIDAPAAAITAPIRTDPTPASDPSTEREAAAPAAPAPMEPPNATEPTATTKGALRVRVVDADGKGCANVRVAVHPAADLTDLGRPLQFVPTAEGGRVAWAGLTPGEYAIDVDRVGNVRTVLVEAGRTIEQRIELAAGVGVRGSVRDRSGNPMPDAHVVLHGNRAATVAVATTDANGAFVIHHVTAGVELQARAAGRTPSLVHRVRGAAGGEISIDLVIGDAARTITGRVLGPDGRPVAGAAVAILPIAATRQGPPTSAAPVARASWLRTDAEGAFRSDEATAGVSLVFASASGLAPTWVEVDADRAPAFADLRLATGARLEGTVQRDGAPMPFAQVMLWPLDEPPIGYLLNLFGRRMATTAADGTFRLTGLLPLRQSARAMLGNGTLLEERELLLRDGETTTWNVDARKGQRLVIRVEGAESLGATRLVAFVTKTTLRNGEMPQLVPIEGNGLGAHTGPRPEPVDVVLAAMPGGTSLLQLAAVRNVAPSERSVRFVLSPGDVPKHSIRGRLVDRTAAPLANATVAAMKNSADGLVVRLETTTAADGTFAIGPLPAGDYTILEGSLRDARPVGTAVLTADRDENVGDLRPTTR